MEQNTSQDTEIAGSSIFLDITGEVCPLTFVRTKLLFERIGSGQIAEIRLRVGEPLNNIPRQLESLGHRVLSVSPESDPPESAAIFRIRVRKG